MVLVANACSETIEVVQAVLRFTLGYLCDGICVEPSRGFFTLNGYVTAQNMADGFRHKTTIWGECNENLPQRCLRCHQARV